MNYDPFTGAPISPPPVQNGNSPLRELTAGNDRWMETVPNSLYGLFPNGYRAPCRSENSRAFDLLYNVDTGEYNRAPAAGTYRYIHVRVEFSKRVAYLTVTEYNLTYIG